MSESPTAGLRMDLLREIVAALPRPGARTEFYGRLMDALFRTMDVRRVLLALRVDGELRTVASRSTETADPAAEVEVSRTILRECLDKGVGQRFDNALFSLHLRVRESVHRLGILSVLCVPVPVRGRPEGVLYADNRLREASFEEEDLQYLEILGRLAGVVLENLDHAERLDRENEELRSSLLESARTVIASRAMQEVLRKARLAAASNASVLITGESGVGKELVALEIHGGSARRDGPFVALNCAAVPESLLEAELFGLAPRSGVSGAPPEGREGRFERAGGGTLFLDEIADMGLSSQARILRVLQERTVERIGGTGPVPIDIRVIAATNRELEAEVAAGRFRKDLYYRLKVVEIAVPPLRDRREDVLPLAEQFLKCLDGGRRRFSPEACEAMLRHPWPGNVRELRNAVEGAVVLCDGGVVGTEHLPPDLLGEAGPAVGRRLPTLEEVEGDHIRRVLAETGGNMAEAAQLLGIARSTLYVRMRRLGLRTPAPPRPESGPPA